MDDHLQSQLEERSRALFAQSVTGLDYATRSRLTRARAAALEAASGRRAWSSRFGRFAPAGVTAAAVLGAALWLGSPMMRHAVTVNDGQTNLEDLDLVASSDGNADAMDMLQDDVEFYDWANRAAGSTSAASS